eukprot:XP_011439940.1 PREDICTED: multiple epidermal growth factor-like domains protein 11 [Crassostrea gigas]
MSTRNFILGKIIVFYFLQSTCSMDNCFFILANGKCCEHYMRIKNNNTCKPCPGGYTGDSCHIPCPFPSYGPKCQQECHTCFETSCDHVHGCPMNSSSGEKIGNATTFKMEQTTLSLNEEHPISNSTERGNRKLTATRHIMVAILCLAILATSGFLIKLTMTYFNPCKKLYEIA